MNQTVEKERLRRRKQNQRRARTKRFFMVLGVLVVALAAFLITVKICKPDFDFSLLVPDKAVTFVQENVLGHTTTAPTTRRHLLRRPLRRNLLTPITRMPPLLRLTLPSKAVRWAIF